MECKMKVLVLILFLVPVLDGFLSAGDQQAALQLLSDVVAKMKLEMDTLKQNLTTVQDENRSLKQTIQILMKQQNQTVTGVQQAQTQIVAQIIQSLENKVDGLQHTVTSLQNENKLLKLTQMEEKQEIHNVTRLLQTQTQNITSELQSQHNKISSLQITTKHDVVALAALINNTKTQQQQVAFNVYMYSGTFDTNQPLRFYNVYINIGGGFRNDTFHCPVAGLYLFSVTLTSRQSARYKIVRNGVKIAAVFTSSNTQSVQESGSVTFLAHLAVGDRIWIQSPFHNTYRFSYFTGLLISP